MLEIGAQLHVADLDGQHRVLQRREHPIGVADRRDGTVEEALRALGRRSGDSRRERPGCRAMAFGEAGVRAPHTPVCHLHRAEQLRLHPVGVAFVEQLVCLSQRRKRRAERFGRLGNGVEQLLPGIGGRVGHAHRLVRVDRYARLFS